MQVRQLGCCCSVDLVVRAESSVDLLPQSPHDSRILEQVIRYSAQSCCRCLASSGAIGDLLVLLAGATNGVMKLTQSLKHVQLLGHC